MKLAVIFAFVALAGAVIAEGVLLRRQERRLQELESSLSRQSTPEGASEILRKAGVDPARAGDRPRENDNSPFFPATREALDAAVAERTARLEQRLASLEKSAGDAAAGRTSAADLDAAVAKKVNEKLGEQKKSGGMFGEEKKRPLIDVAADLGLTPQQEDQMARAIDASQKTLFGILTTPRNDGTNFLDDFVEALRDPEHAEEKGKAILLRIFTEKIPGTDEAYLSRIMLEKHALNEEFRKFLTEDQMKKYERLGQDPHDIQTGYDPFGQYVAERLSQK